MQRLIAMCSLFLACPATAQPRFQAGVERYVERRDICDHFRGEEPYDEERREFLHRRLVEFCAGTDKELAELKHKYRNNKAVTERLNRYEPFIER
jgi:hypothetical protein